MRRVSRIVFAGTVLFAVLGTTLAVAQQPARPVAVPNEILVRLNAAQPALAAQVAGTVSASTVVQVGRAPIYRIGLPAGASTAAAIATLATAGPVEAVSLNYYRYMNAFPNDPDFDELWGLHNTGQTGGLLDADIDAPEAWDITQGSEDVVVAVIDSGANVLHDDLRQNIWVNPGEDLDSSGTIDASDFDGIDSDGNGYVDDLVGWDFADGDNRPSPVGGPCVGHGTHTAGTVGATGDNGIGLTGVSWNTKIMVLKAFRPLLGIFCSATDAALIASIEYATLMSADLSSNSWGGGPFNQILSDTIEANQALFVAAAGNDGSDNDAQPAFPAGYGLRNVVSVSATDHNDALADFSNFGATSVDLAAPGVSILSTLPTNAYGSLSGTSMATPHVAGVAALLLAQDPSYTFVELKDRLLRGVDVVPGLSGTNLTGGRLNAFGALTAPLASETGVSVELVLTGPAQVVRGTTLDFEIHLTNHTAQPISGWKSLYLTGADGKPRFLVPPKYSEVPGSATLTFPLSFPVPSGAPTGTYTIFAQVSNPDSVDEESIEVEVVP